MWLHCKGCSTDRSQSICGLSCRSPVAGDMVSLCGRRGSRVTTKPAHRPKGFRHERQPPAQPSFSPRHGPNNTLKDHAVLPWRPRLQGTYLEKTSLKHSSTVDARLNWTSWKMHAPLLTKANYQAEVQELPFRLALNWMKKNVAQPWSIMESELRPKPRTYHFGNPFLWLLDS